jgi:hypothetical protein
MLEVFDEAYYILAGKRVSLTTEIEYSYRRIYCTHLAALVRRYPGFMAIGSLLSVQDSPEYHDTGSGNKGKLRQVSATP